MRTIHRQMLERIVDEAFEREPGLEAAYGGWLHHIQVGRFPQAMLDAVVQKTVRSHNIYDAFVFANVSIWINTGKMVFVQIPLGAIPGPDKEVDRNRQALAGLPPEFTTHVQSGANHEGDGYLEWNRRILLPTNSTPASKIVVEPDAVSLEIGTTSASRTYLHLCEESGLARWPYGSEDVHLFYWTKGRPEL